MLSEYDPSTEEIDDDSEEEQEREFVEQLRSTSLVCTRPRILLAEDDEEMRAMLAEGLRTDGYEVVEIADGQQLMRSIEFHRHVIQRGRFFDVDLIISDVRMPGLSGLSVLRQLRQVDQVTPVILITAFGDDLTHSEGYRLEAEAVIDKPFDLDEFRNYIRELLPPHDEDAAFPG